MKIAYKEIDIESWSRKQTYFGFKKFRTPQISIDFDLFIGDAFSFCKKNEISFFDFILFHSLKTVNSIENFRYRMRGDKVILHEVIHPDWVVMNGEGR